MLINSSILVLLTFSWSSVTSISYLATSSNTIDIAEDLNSCQVEEEDPEELLTEINVEKLIVSAVANSITGKGVVGWGGDQKNV